MEGARGGGGGGGGRGGGGGKRGGELREEEWERVFFTSASVSRRCSQSLASSKLDTCARLASSLSSKL